MSISDAAEAAILKLVFNATAWANFADNTATSAQTNTGVSLHTADPGEAGDATTSEATYTGYTRVNVARTTGGWTVSGTAPTTVNPVAAITFPAGSGGSGTVTYFATAKSNASPPTGAQALLWSGTVSPNIVTGNGITPQLTTASALTLD